MENWSVTKQLIASLIRHVLTAAAAFLVTKGWVDAELANAWVSEATAIAAGALIFLAVGLWKYANARFNILALIKAVQTDPPADTPKEVFAAVEDVKAEVKQQNIVAPV